MTSELRLRIGKKWYLVTSLSPNPVADHDWRLTILEWSDDGKSVAPGETHYDVAVMHGMAICSCREAHWQKEPKRLLCKHAKSLIGAGLLPNTKAERVH